MSADITTITQYTENFIPFEFFILVFIFSMIFLILSVVAKKGNIMFSALSAVTTIFLIYSTFFLRWNTVYIPTYTEEAISDTAIATSITEIANVNQMFLSIPTLWLLIGMFAFSVISLWMNVGYMTQKALKPNDKDNKNVEEGGLL